jgi:hypothetical protein
LAWRGLQKVPRLQTIVQAMTHSNAQLKDAAMKPLLKASDEAEFKRRYASQVCANPEGARIGADMEWERLQWAGIAEKPLEEGPYWVRLVPKGTWRLAIYEPSKDAETPWSFPYGNTCANSASICEISPRILPPSQEGTDGQ